MLTDWYFWITEQDPLQLVMLGFTFASLVAILRLDAGLWRDDVRALRRRLVSCPLRQTRAMVVLSRDQDRQDRLVSCSIRDVDPGLSCEDACLAGPGSGSAGP